MTIGRLISRTVTRLGLTTPAFIHNSSYFLVNLQVYEDGLVDCWELLDLKLFREKLQAGWVVVGVPDGEDLSVHGLGDFETRDGKWDVSSDELFARVNELIRELNPNLRNLHDCHGETVEVRGKVRASILGSPTERPLRVADDFHRTHIRGDHISMLLEQQGDVYVADVRVFSDATVELGRVPEPLVMDVDALRELAEKHAVFSKPKKGTRVFIHGLGSFGVSKARFMTGAKDMLAEVQDLVDALNGRPDSSTRCKDAYDTYMAQPTQAHRAALRAIYEAVPEHNRMYVLRDQDVKDIPIRMIIYGDQEIESWSHRAVARARGDQLPSIRVPKPTDES